MWRAPLRNGVDQSVKARKSCQIQGDGRSIYTCTHKAPSSTLKLSLPRACKSFDPHEFRSFHAFPPTWLVIYFARILCNCVSVAASTPRLQYYFTEHAVHHQQCFFFPALQALNVMTHHTSSAHFAARFLPTISEHVNETHIMPRFNISILWLYQHCRLPANNATSAQRVVIWMEVPKDAGAYLLMRLSGVRRFATHFCSAQGGYLLCCRNQDLCRNAVVFSHHHCLAGVHLLCCCS
jgi:hypothetical protein